MVGRGCPCFLSAKTGLQRWKGPEEPGEEIIATKPEATHSRLLGRFGAGGGGEGSWLSCNYWKRKKHAHRLRRMDGVSFM